ncbi:MAG TPA: hypothetical protein VFK46_01785 [Candidatus Macondimonas sp.]|nr:hypothetical protein [Candidatus Macondimonas sp.]
MERVFGAHIARNKLDEMQMIAEEAVRFGYRAATPLDLDADLDDAVGPAGANPMDGVSNQERRSP